MKKRRKLINICVGSILLILIMGGCGKKEREVEEQRQKVLDVKYQTNEVTTFCVDEEGRIYTCEEGKETICLYDKSGVKLYEIEVDGGTKNGKRYSAICVSNDYLYASDSVEKGIVAIEVATGERELLYATQDSGFWNLLDMTVCNDCIYFIYQKPIDYAEMQLLSNLDAGYSNMGERAVCLDLKTREVEEMDIKGVKRLCKKNSNEILFYGYDEENGFYYRVYDTEAHKYSAEYEAKQDSGMRNTPVMVYDESNEKILYPDTLKGYLQALDLINPSCNISFYLLEDSVRGVNSLQCVNGCTYFVSGGKVMRIDNASYIMKEQPLTVCTISQNYMPVSGIGYELNVVEMDSEMLTNKLLAGDDDFDLLILSSEYDLSRQIERTGAYMPLNGVEKIETYLEGCFDYIEEAATAENNAIWMFPYEVNCDVILYQPELCEQYGIDFADNLTYEKFVKYWGRIEEVSTTDSVKYHVWMHVWKRLLEAYLIDYAIEDGKPQFDTELFRHYAPIMRESLQRKENIIGGELFTQGMTEKEVRNSIKEFLSKFAFCVMSKDYIEQEYGVHDYINGVFYKTSILDFDFFEARSMPSIEEEKEQKGVAYATFYVVNPHSNRKDEAIEYLETLADALTETESIYRTKDLKEEYSKLELQVHEVYKDARVYFDYPSDVVGNEYAKYIKGEIDLEELIQEAERKFNIYLKE